MNPVRSLAGNVNIINRRFFKTSNGVKKTIATIIDELITANIKLYHLRGRKKIKELKSFCDELRNVLDKKSKKGMEKNISSTIDELISTNIKIYYLIDKVQKNKHTREEAKRIQDLNKYRAELCNDLNKKFKEREIIKL